MLIIPALLYTENICRYITEHFAWMAQVLNIMRLLHMVVSVITWFGSKICFVNRHSSHRTHIHHVSGKSLYLVHYCQNYNTITLKKKKLVMWPEHGCHLSTASYHFYQVTPQKNVIAMVQNIISPQSYSSKILELSLCKMKELLAL